jgi:hypothetical protein
MLNAPAYAAKAVPEFSSIFLRARRADSERDFTVWAYFFTALTRGGAAGVGDAPVIGPGSRSLGEIAPAKLPMT